jgi:hypothetical protein
MERCAHCKAEDTDLYENGVPICLKCAELSPERRKVRIALFHSLQEAVRRAEAATETFSAITSNIPSGVPHPDGVQRIHNVSRELKLARDEMMIAHNRLTAFLERGIVPEDLKRSG